MGKSPKILWKSYLPDFLGKAMNVTTGAEIRTISDSPETDGQHTYLPTSFVQDLTAMAAKGLLAHMYFPTSCELLTWIMTSQANV